MRGCRIRKAKVLDLNACNCGVTITDEEIQRGDSIMRCRVAGCETVWVSCLIILAFIGSTSYHIPLGIIVSSFIKLVWDMITCQSSGLVKAVGLEVLVTAITVHSFNM